LQHTPLDITALSDGARKVLTGPPPLKLMAARGLAPLKPAELASVIYHLSLAGAGDQAIQAAAEKSSTELPEKILAAALADPTLDPRVIDFYALRLVGKPVLVEAVLLNRATADATVLEIAPRLGEKELELVAVNEQRLLREPAIIGALYMNKKARMSTVDRAVELAVRNGLTVPGIPHWDDVVAAVLGSAAAPPSSKKSAAEIDAAFAKVASVALVEDKPILGPARLLDDDLEIIVEAENQQVSEVVKELPIHELNVAQKIRLATLGNALARNILIRDPIKVVAVATINSPAVTDNEVIKWSANRTLTDEVIRTIANTKEWQKIYQVKFNLVNNAKCPLPVSMRLLPFLHDRDLAKVTRSKAIPSAPGGSGAQAAPGQG
jgi:hypothetical protein